MNVKYELKCPYCSHVNDFEDEIDDLDSEQSDSWYCESCEKCFVRTYELVLKAKAVALVGVPVAKKKRAKEPSK